MNKKLFLKNVSVVLFSRVATLLSSLVIGFLIPKLLGVTGYGYLKIYTLYTVYTAMLHFGFVDGVLLKFAGKEYDMLNKKKMRTYTVFFIMFQLLIFAAALIVSAAAHNKEYSFIIAMLGVNMVINNVTTYYQFVSQATQRFKEYSIRGTIVAVLKILLVFSLLLLSKQSAENVSYRTYVVALNIIDAVLLAWYLATYRDITFGEKEPFSICIPEIKELFRNGIILTVAYQAAHLAFALDRQFVSALYSTEVYAIYSFAYSIISMISMLISSSSTVFFPMLKSINRDSTMQYYTKANAVVSVVAAGALVTYFPLCWFVNWFLPDYVAALPYLRIVLPSLMFSGCISIIMFTFYKVVDKNLIYFKTACAAIVMGLLLNYTAQYIFATPAAISWASLITIAVWYIAANHYFVTEYRCKLIKNFTYCLALAAAYFVITHYIRTMWAGMLTYAAVYLTLTVLLMKIKPGAALLRRKTEYIN